MHKQQQGAGELGHSLTDGLTCSLILSDVRLEEFEEKKTFNLVDTKFNADSTYLRS